MSAGKRIIVWSWEDERLTWRPYDPHVSNFIEHNKSTGPMVNLGPVDIKMKHYCIDMKNLIQLRIGTGTQRKIDRLVYGEDSALGQGATWQYEGDVPNTWQPYDPTFANVLENAFRNNEDKLDLRQPPLYMPYTVNLLKMVQTRCETKRKRKIQRVTNTNPVQYLQETGGSLATAALAASTFGTSMPPSATSPVKSGGFGSLYSSLSSAVASFGASLPASNPAVAGAVTRSKVRKSSTGKSARPSSSFGTSYVPTGTSGSLPTGGARPKTTRNNIKPYGSISNMVKQPSKIKKKKSSKASEFDQILMPVVEILTDPPKDEDCCVCMSELRENSGMVDEKHSVVIKLKCKHMYHKSCLKAMYDSGHKDECIQCPACKAIYGIKRGNCPAGTMTYDTLSSSLPGHEDCDTIRVTYDIQPGTQGQEHPHPGEKYRTQGFPRIGFLPNSTEGQKILKLLTKAWERRLTFTVAESVTTGAKNSVVWNGIHHKTEIIDHSGHGYPAPNFLDNVKLECSALGIVDSDDEEKPEVKMETNGVTGSSSEDDDL